MHMPSALHHPPAAPCPGLRLRYLESGPSGSSEVVLLLHDIGEAADNWRRVAAMLADRGYRVLAPDLRGEPGPASGS